MAGRRQIVSCCGTHAIRCFYGNGSWLTYDGVTIDPRTLHPLEILPNNPEFKAICLGIYFRTNKMPIITEANVCMLDADTGKFGPPVRSTDVDETRELLLSRPKRNR